MNPQLSGLLKKYDIPGPRYTSYPTAPAWISGVNSESYRQSLQSLKCSDPLSLYFHLPFCENLCHFCGCTTVITTKHDRSHDYVNILLKEVDQVVSCFPKEAKKMTVSQLHFGGGSPNFLKPEELKEIVGCVRKNFDLLSDAEMAIEMHPRTSTNAFCEMVAQLGFNRISLGVQDLDPKVQKLINRHQTFEMTESMMHLLRALGLHSFNLDLVYGLPGQSVEGWTKTLEQVIALQPNRLAVYSYAHIPWVRPVQRSFKDSDLPSPEMKIRFFEMAYQTFIHNKYRLIGMDHFATEEDDLSAAVRQGTIHRNFMGYSTKADAHQLGFGMSAISFVGGNYFQNQKELEAYKKSVESHGLATFRGYLLHQDDSLRRDLIQKIMCRGLVEISQFEKEWNISFRNYFADELNHLDSFVEDGLLRRTNEVLEVVGDGFLFLRNMAMVFDRYLEGIREKSANPVFSRTV